MELKFVAPGLALIPIPGLQSAPGDPAKRLSMRFVGPATRPNSRERGAVPRYVPVERVRGYDTDTQPVVCESLLRMARKGHILPADEQSAKAAGVRYVPLTWAVDTGWEAKTKSASAPKTFAKKAEVTSG